MGEVILVLISVSNAAFADASSERLAAYKGNKLIPHEVNIATINSASSEHSDVAVFTPSVLSWKSYSNMQNAAFSKFMDWTKEDFEEFFKGYTNDTYEKYVDAWNFLSQTGNDHLQGAVISDEDAIAVLQAQLEKLVSERSIDSTPFPCEGLDFSGLVLSNCKLENFTGMTADQLFSAISIRHATLPAIDFTGVDFRDRDLQGVNFSKCTNLTADQLLSAAHINGTTLPSVNFAGAKLNGLNLDGVDFSKCTNLTAAQLLEATNLTNVKLPAIDFSDVDLTGKRLYGVDFTKCTGLTGTQLSNARGISEIWLTSEQYESMKTNLPSGTYIHVNGDLTEIP